MYQNHLYCLQILFYYIIAELTYIQISLVKPYCNSFKVVIKKHYDIDGVVVALVPGDLISAEDV